MSPTSAGAYTLLSLATERWAEAMAQTSGLKLGPVGSIIFIVLAVVLLLTAVISAVILLKEISEW